MFTIGLRFKNENDEFTDVTDASGEIGAGIGLGIHVAYWVDPKQDMPGVETTDAQIMVEALPNLDNAVNSYTLSVNSVSRLKVHNGVGNPGDVKVEYEIV